MIHWLLAVTLLTFAALKQWFLIQIFRINFPKQPSPFVGFNDTNLGKAELFFELYCALRASFRVHGSSSSLGKTNYIYIYSLSSTFLSVFFLFGLDLQVVQVLFRGRELLNRICGWSSLWKILFHFHGNVNLHTGWRLTNCPQAETVYWRNRSFPRINF